jgi:hypothetical protein
LSHRLVWIVTLSGEPAGDDCLLDRVGSDFLDKVERHFVSGC